MFIHLAPVVRRSDDAIQWINLYPVDNATRFAITYPQDSDLSVGQRYPPSIQLGPEPIFYSILAIHCGVLSSGVCQFWLSPLKCFIWTRVRVSTNGVPAWVFVIIDYLIINFTKFLLPFKNSLLKNSFLNVQWPASGGDKQRDTGKDLLGVNK